MERPGVVTEFQIRAAESVHDDAALTQLCRKIESLRNAHDQSLGLKAQSTHEFVDTATESKLGTAMAWATSAIVLSLSLAAMLNTMLMSVMERTVELGVLRAVGWRRSRVIRMILGESVVMSLIGAGIGSLAAWILVRALSHWPSTSLFVPTSLSGEALALGFSAAIVAGVAGSFYPAFRAASVPPIEALRYE